MKTFVCLITFGCAAFLTFPSFSQKAIQLTKVASGKKLVILTGHRVVCSVKSESKAMVGLVDMISENAVTIKGREILYDEIVAIGRRRKGSGFLTYMWGMMGAGMIISSFQGADDPCPNCIDEGNFGEGEAILSGITGAGLVALSFNTGVRNSPRELGKKWTLEVIDALPSK